MVGFDPGLTVQSALKLPRETKLLASVKAVLETSDYVSLNIPFINKPVSEGGCDESDFMIESFIVLFVL